MYANTSYAFSAYAGDYVLVGRHRYLLPPPEKKNDMISIDIPVCYVRVGMKVRVIRSQDIDILNSDHLIVDAGASYEKQSHKRNPILYFLRCM